MPVNRRKTAIPARSGRSRPEVDEADRHKRLLSRDLSLLRVPTRGLPRSWDTAGVPPQERGIPGRGCEPKPPRGSIPGRPLDNSRITPSHLTTPLNFVYLLLAGVMTMVENYQGM